MSKRMSRNDVRSFARAVGKPVFYTGYYELQSLVSRWEKIGYNSGVYGWNWDCYNFPDFVLVTGYRNQCGTKMKHCEEFNSKAYETIHDTWPTYKDTYGDYKKAVFAMDERLNGIAHELFLAQKED